MKGVICLVLALALTACAGHRQVKVNCSNHLVRINANSPTADAASEPQSDSTATDGPPSSAEEQP